MKKLTVLLVGLMVVALVSPARAGITVSGVAQAQIVNDESLVGKELSFSAKRARLIARGDLGDKVGVFAQLDLLAAQPVTGLSLSTGSVESNITLLDLVMDYDLGAIGKIGVGRFLIPFGLQSPVPVYNLHTINYSQVVTKLLGPALRDIGIRLVGKYDIVDYALGYVNGSETKYYITSNSDDNDAKGVAGRIGISVPGVKGLGVGVSVVSNKAGATKTTFDRTGADVKYDADPISVQLEYITGDTAGVKASGYYLEAGYKIGSLQPMIRYESYDPNTDADATTAQQELTILAAGANVYIGKNAKVQIFSETKTEKPTDLKNNAVIVQTAVKF